MATTTPATTTARTDTWLIVVTIDGVSAGTWDTFKGGDNDSTTQSYRPGSTGQQRVIGGQSTVSPITVEKSMERETDWALMGSLMRASIGKSVVQISRQLLDIDRNPYGGHPLIYNGILKQVLPGDVDSNKADVSMWSLIVVPAGTIG
jgi:hypothetical protein